MRNPEFGKEILLSLTKKGWEVYRWHEEYHRTMDADFISRVGAVPMEQVVIFGDLLKRILKAVDTYSSHSGE